MIKLENWDEITKGLYRYVIGPNCCYEIHVMYHTKGTDILTANASLYIVGDWFNHKNHLNYFERELLLKGSLRDCLEGAVKDEETMMG